MEDPDLERDLELDLVPDLPLFLFFLSCKKNIIEIYILMICCSPFSGSGSGSGCQLECIAIVPGQEWLLLLH